MGFYQELKNIHTLAFYQDEVNEIEINNAINADVVSFQQFQYLLSVKVDSVLEKVAQKANVITTRHFGKTIQIYAPLYISNYCVNQCVYCGFKENQNIQRLQLSSSQICGSANVLTDMGINQILVLTGDAPHKSTLKYTAESCRLLRSYFDSISIEIPALDILGYKTMVDSGVDGLTIYQETYQETDYQKLHLKGPKKDFEFRLKAPQVACEAGIRKINIGCLLGLSDWRKDVSMLGAHASWLQKQFPGVELSVSLPRIRPEAGGFVPHCVVSDRELVQAIIALRCFLPGVGITISTRESAQFRDHILPLGVTKMSAGSVTSVGGYEKSKQESAAQFEISDSRSIAKFTENIKRNGYQPVFKDWQPIN